MFLLKSFSQVSFSPTSFVFDGVVPPLDQPILSGGLLDFASKYKYRYNVDEEVITVLEKAARERIDRRQLVTLEKTFRDMGVAYRDSYRDAFVAILAQLRIEKQEAEDEQIMAIIASML